MTTDEMQSPKISDRNMREAISELRATDKGRWIVASQKEGGGYFTAESKSEALEYISPDYSRCYTKLGRLSKQLKAIEAEITPQMELGI